MAWRRVCLAHGDGQRADGRGQLGGDRAFSTALRGTIIGWAAITNSLGALAAHSSVALLAGPLSGLSVVVGYLALFGLPGALLYAIFIDETRGMTLEAASRETLPGS
jgi:hypothetical protein